MSATRKAIERAIIAGEKRLAKIDSILNANHLSKVIQLHKKANEIIQTNDDHAIIAKQLEQLAKEEKAEFAAFDRQSKNYLRLFQEQLRIDRDLEDLRNSLWLLNLRKGSKQ